MKLSKLTTIVYMLATITVLTGCGGNEVKPMTEAEFYQKQDAIIQDCKLRKGKVFRGYIIEMETNKVNPQVGCISDAHSYN